MSRVASEVQRGSGREHLPPELLRTFAHLHPTALGVAVGAVGALVLFLATIVLVLRGGETVGPHLWLLAHYLPGYGVSTSGSIVGAAYGFAAGFAAGWSFARLRNHLVHRYLRSVWRRAERESMTDLLDRLS